MHIGRHSGSCDQDAPHLKIGGAIVVALTVWAFVSWASENGAWEARLIFAHDKEAVVSEKRNELEATVQLLSNQITAEATTQEMAAMTQRVATVARELASANSALSRFIP